MVTQTINELAAIKARVAALDSELARELNAARQALPAAYGFDSVQAFAKALHEVWGKRLGRSTGAVAANEKRTRAKITDATREEVKTLLEVGRTGAEIPRRSASRMRVYRT